MPQSLTEELKLIITADMAEATENLKSLESEVDLLGKTTAETTNETEKLSRSQDTGTSTAKSLAASVSAVAAKYLALGVAVRTAYSFIRQGVLDAEKENQSLAALQATLSATGRSAEISVGRIDAAASRMEDSFNADKQAIMDASAELAIMQNVSSDLFERIIEDSTDLSYILRSDVGSAISTIGRVLEDPISGMSRLERSGIFISESTRKQIEMLIEQNRLYDAQVLILEEIEQRVGGTAEKVAEVSSFATLSTSWGKFVGSTGQVIDGMFTPFVDFMSTILNYLDSSNSITLMASEIRSLTAEEIGKMDIGQLNDIISTVEQLKALDAPTQSAAGRAVEKWQELNDLAYERLALLQKMHEKEVIDSEIAERRLKDEEERQVRLAEEATVTENLRNVWVSTDEGRKSSLAEQIDLYSKMMQADKDALQSGIDPDIQALIQKRLEMYGSVIDALSKELDNLSEKETDIISDILGTSASSFVSDIPLTFDFGRNQLETVEAQISAVKAAINTLWAADPEEDQMESWQTALDTLKAKYDELVGVQADLKKEAATKADAEKEFADLKARSEQELLRLLSEEELAKKNLGEYESLLLHMLDNRLISQEEFNRLLEQEKETLGLSGKELSSWEKQVAVLKDEFGSFLQMQFSSEALASDMSGLFSTWGDAIASGENAGDAMMSALSDWTQQLTSQLSSMFISAGLRVIIEGGYAGLPLGLALIAAGGLTGFASGLMGGSGPALSDEVMQSMNEEMDAREKLAQTINDSIDQEYELLRRQLDRNLIGEEEFIDKAGDLQSERNEADARADVSNALFNRITALNNEYASMSGWDKFWSGRDEDIEEELEKLQALFESVDSATTEELRELIDKLQSLGINTSGISRFASGGDFVTSGPQLILVGDNPGGRERVRITPITHEFVESSSSGGNIYIVGDVYGLEDLNGKLKLINEKTARRRS